MGSVGVAFGNVYITEWMYNSVGTGGEFVEITNTGASAIDLTGWSFDDDSQTPGGFSLSGIGVLAAGASALITEVSDADFRLNWGLSNAVQIAGSNTVNLGRSDEINIFNASNVLVDRLTFSDVNIPGSIRTNGISGNALPAHLGTNTVINWFLSASGDSFGSYTSQSGDLANPGSYAPVPEPTTLAALGLGAMALIRRKRK